MTRDQLAVHGGPPVRAQPFPAWPPPVTQEQRDRLLAVLDSGDWGATAGQETDDLAASFAALADARYGVCVSSGTIALFVAVRALGIGRGDEVIIPAYTFVASATAVLLAGARPVVVDVTEDTLHIDCEAAEAAITPRTRAIMPVHIAGAPAPMGAVVDLARRHGLAIVEDAAQAHGAEVDGRAVGAIGDIGCFSFQSTKPMTAGEGGIVITDSAELHARAWALHNVGRRLEGQWYEHPSIGWNLRMTEFQSALLIPQLAALPEQVERREEAAALLAQRLAEDVAGLSVMASPPGTTRHSRHLLLLRYDQAAFAGMAKADFVAALRAEGIPCDTGYNPLNREPALREGPGVEVTPCPIAEDAADRSVVWLRQDVLMAGQDDLETVVEAAAKVQRLAT